MTVAELIEKLGKYPLDRRVWVWNSEGDIVEATTVETDKFDEDCEIVVVVT
jgi:hypothetical protein